MFILINGAFGIGKSTVARELRALLPASLVYDPEPIGVVLQRAVPSHVSDFQQLMLWRRLTVSVARCLTAVRAPVIIPMAFSDVEYLEDIRSGLARSGQPVHHFCLTAPLDVIRERLTRRGEPMTEPRWAWVHRRAEECCRAHQGTSFATHVSAEARPPSAIAADLAARIGRSTC